MKRRHRQIAAALGVVGLFLFGRPHAAQAVVKALDTAADPAYGVELGEGGGAWRGLNPTAAENPAGTDNGGFGFGPWNFAGGYYPQDYAPQAYGRLNHFIDGVDFTASTFNNLGGPAFGLTGCYFPTSGPTAFATRPFSAPLAVGDTFSFEIDTPAVYDDLVEYVTYPFVAIILLDSNNEVTLDLSSGDTPNFPLSGGPFPWSYKTSSTGTGAGTGLSPYATSDGSAFTYKLTSATTATFTLDGQSFNITLAKGAPASLKLFLYNNPQGNGVNPFDEEGNVPLPTGERELFFDNLKIESSAAVPIPGDFNNNGGVGSADLAKWRTDFGVNGGSNADGDSDSDGADFLIWQKNFGQGTGGGLGSSPTPEPASALLAIVGLAFIGRRRTSRR